MSEHWSYDILKHIIATEKDPPLEDFKSLLRDEIGSARNMCRIKTMEDLIDCLERRDALSEYNIEPLREMADYLGNPELSDAISGYSSPKDRTSYDDPYNQYRELRLACEVRSHLNINGHRLKGNYPLKGNDELCNFNHKQSQEPLAPVPTPYPQIFTDKKRAAVFKMIAENIGKFWRAFGRELQIRQGQLDEIEMQYPLDLVSRVHKLLQVFEEDESHDPNQRVLILSRALEDCRRKDLRRKLENIMSY